MCSSNVSFRLRKTRNVFAPVEDLTIYEIWMHIKLETGFDYGNSITYSSNAFELCIRNSDIKCAFNFHDYFNGV